MKAQFNQLLEEQRKKVHHLEEKILKMKMSYADALHNLEEISDEIHEKRKSGNRNEIEGAESSHLSCDSIKLPYQKLNSSDSSSENMSMENLNVEDMYMSLPSKITLRPGIIAASCIGNNSEKPSSKPESPEESSLGKMQKIISVSKKSNVQYKMNNFLDKKHVNQSVSLSNDSTTVSNHSEQLNTSNIDNLHEDKFSGLDDVSLNGEEIPDCKFLSPDLNILRIHREEMSDSESLASTDTTDTLDDNQIECLLLEKMLPLETEEADGEKVLDNKADENVHL
ncbi:SH3 domain-binding protein 5-like [Trichonephila clavipes]|nr:SH3 domain-binding protein 5-like [Trichonephila clavipes]